MRCCPPAVPEGQSWGHVAGGLCRIADGLLSSGANGGRRCLWERSCTSRVARRLTIKMQTQVTAALRPAYEVELVAELPSRNRAWGSTSRRPGKRPPSRGCGRSSPVCSRCSSGATAVQRPSWPRRLTNGYAGVVTCDRAKDVLDARKVAMVLGPSQKPDLPQALADSDDAVVKARLGRDLLRPTASCSASGSRLSRRTIGRAVVLKRDLTPIRWARSGGVVAARPVQWPPAPGRHVPRAI